MTKKKKKSSGCFCCSDAPSDDCDELAPPILAKDACDFEYIVENMSIKRAPKKLLYKQAKIEEVVSDLSVPVTKKVTTDLYVGPVPKIEDADIEEAHKKLVPLAAPIYEICKTNSPPLRRPGVAQAFHAQTKHIINDSALKAVLMPHQALYLNAEKQKVSADVEEPIVEEAPKSPQEIPPDIKKAIDALKVARPLHINSKVAPTNRRSLIRSSSCTSYDTETLCDVTDDNEKTGGQVEKKRRTPKMKRRHFSPNKINACSSTSDFPEHFKRNENVSSSLKSSEKTEGTDSIQGQSLKWKIIINKHDR